MYALSYFGANLYIQKVRHPCIYLMKTPAEFTEYCRVSGWHSPRLLGGCPSVEGVGISGPFSDELIFQIATKNFLQGKRPVPSF